MRSAGARHAPKRPPAIPPGQQTIFRMAAPERPFTMICNAALRDVDLTPTQLAVLVFMISQPPTFRASLERVAELRGLGRDRVREAVLGCKRKGTPGLIHLGYCLRRRDRDPVTKEFGAWEYCFTDQRGMFSASTGFPQEFHSDAEPAPENQGVGVDQAENSSFAGDATNQPLKSQRLKTRRREFRAPIKNDQSNNRPTPQTTFAAGSAAGDATIPFDEPAESEESGFSMDLAANGVLATLVEPAERRARIEGKLHGQEQQPMHETLRARDWLPFSAQVFVKIRRLCVDPEEAVLRYLAGTKGEKIRNPDAYLLRIAIDLAARRRGVDMATVAREIQQFRVDQAAIMAEAAIAPKQLAQASPALRAMLATQRRA